MAKGQPILFFEYAACGTCRKAKKWLDQHGVTYQSVPIVDAPPKLDDLARLVKDSDLPIQKWFNTSGQSYRALLARLGKDGWAKLDDPEKLRLLSNDGKMIKRPILVVPGRSPRVLLGFDEAAYQARL